MPKDNLTNKICCTEISLCITKPKEAATIIPLNMNRVAIYANMIKLRQVVTWKPLK